MDLYHFSDYRKAIDALVKNSKSKVLWSDLAKAAECSSSWITRVFTGSVQLTTDQLLGIAHHFHLNELETDYLIHLLELERASSSLMRKRLELKLSQLKKEAKELRIPVTKSSQLTELDSYKYYSSWMHAALHVATMIQTFTAAELTTKFQLNINSTLKILSDLEQMGLVQGQSGKWQATSQNIHLSASSPMARLAHMQWRNFSIAHLQNPLSEGLHYSGPQCLSHKDVLIINEKLKNALMECRQIIDESPSETMAILCLDWYQLNSFR